MPSQRDAAARSQRVQLAHVGQSPLGPRLTGFLEPPAASKPLPSDITDGRRALVTVVAVDRTADAVPGPLRVPGLVAQGRYRVGLHPLWPADPRHGKLPAGPFQSEDGLTLDGRVLRDAGLALPILLLGTGILLVLDRVE